MPATKLVKPVRDFIAERKAIDSVIPRKSSVPAVTAQTFLTTNASTTVPIRVSDLHRYFQKAIVYGLKTLSGTANTGSVYIGTGNSAGQQPIEIAAGGEYVLEPPSGQRWDLFDWFLTVASANDGIVVIYA